SIFVDVRKLGSVQIPCMLPESQDHVISKAPSARGPSLFLTSDQCATCHNATGTLFSREPNIIYTPPGASAPVHLSPEREWRCSMMGLSVRDAIFFGQRDTESTLHANIKGKSSAPGFV